ncbi:MAG TPA: hypothetical protein VIV06_07185, partial [Candidatus Limnocylindrales bacterium]
MTTSAGAGWVAVGGSAGGRVAAGCVGAGRVARTASVAVDATVAAGGGSVAARAVGSAVRVATGGLGLAPMDETA